MLVDPSADLVEGEETALRGEVQLARQVEGARDVSAARASAAGAGVLAGVAGIDQLEVGLAEPCADVVSCLFGLP